MSRRFNDDELDDGEDMGWTEALSGFGIALGIVAVAWIFGSAAIAVLFPQ